MKKKYTKMIVGVFCALLIATSAFAAGTNTNTNAITKATGTSVKATNGPVAVQTITVTAPENLSLFNAKEFGISIASGYNVGSAGNINTKTAFTQPYTLNFNAGAFYFPWRNVGFEANVPFYQNKGASVDEVQVGMIFRLPLSKTTPILKNISPYLGVDGVYNWQTAQNWAYIGKVGTEFRFNKRLGIFVEGQYRNSEFQNWANGNIGLNGGIRLVF